MNKAGVDIGCTFVKIAWKVGGQFRFASTRSQPLGEITDNLRKDGITEVNVIGLGAARGIPRELESLGTVHRVGHDIPGELMTQARGVKSLGAGILPDSFLLISMGTGTSYTMVRGDDIRTFPIGNCIGAGFVERLGLALGARDHKDLLERASQGETLDLEVQHIVPDVTGDSPKGRRVIASFGRADATSSTKDLLATVIQAAAVMTIRTVLIIDMIPDFQVPADIVVIGAGVAYNPLLMNALRECALLFAERQVLTVPHGEFALAVGALNLE